MDSVFLRENRGHLSENLSTKNYSFGAKMRIIRRLPPNGSHPLRIPRNTRAQVKLAKSLAWPKEWGPCCVAFGSAFGSHPRGRGFESLQVHQKEEHRFAVLFFLVSVGHLTAHKQVNCLCTKVFAQRKHL